MDPVNCSCLGLYPYHLPLPASGNITNKLWTSDTGIIWHPSLPPMPTRRYHSVAVNIGSDPECLVVAGGTNGSMNLDTVEVLVGEQWSTLERLPASS